MTPTIALENMLDHTCRHIQMVGYPTGRQARYAQDTNLPYLILSNSGARIIFATVLSALSGLVGHVARLRTQFKVIGIDAGGIIAGVHNDHAVGNFHSVKELPSQAMRPVCLSLMGDFAVSSGVDVSLPFPTLGEWRGRESGAENVFEGCAIQVGWAATFLRGTTCGSMLSHVVSASSAFGHATGRYSVAVALLLANIPRIVTRKQVIHNAVNVYAALMEAAYRKLVGQP